MTDLHDLKNLRLAAEARVARCESQGRSRAAWHPMRYVWAFLWWRASRWANHLCQLAIAERRVTELLRARASH